MNKQLMEKFLARRRKMLKEDTGICDKIDNYLIKMGEEPLFDVDDSNKTEPAHKPTHKPAHTRKNTTVTESKKTIKKPANLLESLNKGFEQIYGNLDDNKRLTEAKETKKKYPIKEFFADHMDELNKIMNNKKSSEKQKKQEILDLLNSSDVSKAQVDQFARKMEATHDWGFYGFIGTYITAQKVNECVSNKRKSLKENYEKQSDRLNSFLAGSEKVKLLLKGDEEEYGKPHLSSIVLDTAKKKGYKVFDLGRMDFTKGYEEQGFNSPKTLAFVDGYIPRKNASSILALLDDSEFKGKIVVIEYPDRPLDIAVKSRLVESKGNERKKKLNEGKIFKNAEYFYYYGEKDDSIPPDPEDEDFDNGYLSIYELEPYVEEDPDGTYHFVEVDEIDSYNAEDFNKAVKAAEALDVPAYIVWITDDEEEIPWEIIYINSLAEKLPKKKVR